MVTRRSLVACRLSHIACRGSADAMTSVHRPEGSCMPTCERRPTSDLRPATRGPAICDLRTERSPTNARRICYCSRQIRVSGSDMESSLEIGFLRVTKKAAIAAARTMGYNKRKYSDQVAVESMREELNRLKMRGTIVIGEGERDKAPMLYVGEPLGRGWTEGEIYPEVDIAVDPLEGTNLCATGAANSIAVLAASEKGGLLNAPDVYMAKSVVGPTAGCSADLLA